MPGILRNTNLVRVLIRWQCTYTPVYSGVCGTHCTTAGVRVWAEVAALVGSTQDEINSLVSEDLRDDDIQTEESLYKHVKRLKHAI